MGRRSDPRWREAAALELLTTRFLAGLPRDVSGPLLLVDDPADGVPGSVAFDIHRWNREASGAVAGRVTPPEGPFGIAAIRTLRSREGLRYAAKHAASRLRPGGMLVVYGANDEGAGSAGGLLEEVGVADPTTWASGKRCRVLGGRVPDPPEAPDPETAARRYELHLPGLPEREWVGYPGVFASERLDSGTRLLLESMPHLPEHARVLDWGAGSGEIAAFLRERDGAPVTLLERDALAARAARINVPDAEVISGDGWRALPEGSTFTHIIANPPYHVGKSESLEPVLEFLDGVSEHLEPEGEARFVVQRRLRVEPLLAERFARYESVADEGPYRVWKVSV